MHILILITFSLLPLAFAQLNSLCTVSGGMQGVCLSPQRCNQYQGNGMTVPGQCPGTPTGTLCCTSIVCASASSCMPSAHCTTNVNNNNFLRGVCPGPVDYKCCLPTYPNVAGNPLKVLAKAMQAKDVNYVWGGGSITGATPGQAGTAIPGGFDCSGLTSWAIYEKTGRDLFAEGLRHTATLYCANTTQLEANAPILTRVPYASRATGDLVFRGNDAFCNCNATGGSGVHHIGIVMDGLATMWNAFNTGTKIREDPIGSHCPTVLRLAT